MDVCPAPVFPGVLGTPLFVQLCAAWKALGKANGLHLAIQNPVALVVEDTNQTHGHGNDCI